MVTTRSKDRDAGDTAAGSKREAAPEPHKEPAPKQQKYVNSKKESKKEPEVKK